MSRLAVLVVDDEAPARARLRRMVTGIPGYKVVGEAASSAGALKRIGELEPDIVLLDISMPGLSGMDLARSLRQRHNTPAVVFCTAWPDQALDAFDTGAIDYLVKPVRAERLRAALDKAARFAGVAGEPGASGFLQSMVGGRSLLINVQAVVCLHAKDKYTTVYHDEGEALVDESLVDLEREFEALFLRVHRNALVARARIRGLESGKAGTVRVLLDGCEFQPRVSRRQLPAVRRILKEIQ